MNESGNNDQMSGYTILYHFVNVSKAILTVKRLLLAMFWGEYGI